MPYNPQRHYRRSIRLAGYDYTRPGGYFVTICVQNRVHVFGAVVNGMMQLNPYGRVAATYHERIIPDAAAWERIAAYIVNNPAKWEKDRMYG